MNTGLIYSLYVAVRGWTAGICVYDLWHHVMCLTSVSTFTLRGPSVVYHCQLRFIPLWVDAGVVLALKSLPNILSWLALLSSWNRMACVLE